MAKARICYDLDDPEDQRAHLRAIKSIDLCLALYDIDKVAREMWQHYDDKPDAEMTDEERSVKTYYQRIRNAFEENDIDLDQLII